MPSYYNEIDPYAAQWLRNLIARGLIAPGEVDERSILEVQADDLRGYEQCHFFAGIGGWSAALRIAGWPDDRPVWTGSCPCQPFSAAGKQHGSDDERHLWPAFFNLIRECRPRSVFGEQVAGAAGLAWLDHVFADLESAEYAAAAADLPACSVGTPHKRQRLFWVAHNNTAGLSEQREHRVRQNGDTHAGVDFDRRGQDGNVADSAARGLGINGSAPRNPGHAAQRDTVGGLADPNGGNASAEREQCGGQQRQQQEDCGACGLDDTERTGLEGHQPDQGQGRRIGEARPVTEASALDFWRDLEWIKCSDGKARPTQPGLFPLAHGVQNRVGRLRAYGNAIVPQVAAVFVMAACRP